MWALLSSSVPSMMEYPLAVSIRLMTIGVPRLDRDAAFLSFINYNYNQCCVISIFGFMWVIRENLTALVGGGGSQWLWGYAYYLGKWDKLVIFAYLKWEQLA
jgi:hypothetical protein